MAVEWVLGSLILILTALIGALFKMSLDNKGRLASHDVLLATLSENLKKLDGISDHIDTRLNKHEEKEDRVLDNIMGKIERLVISVALLRKSPITFNKDKENA